MGDSTKQVGYEITADGSNFIATMEKTAQAATTAAESIKSKFESIGKAFEAVQKVLLVLTAVVAGGSFFKSAIDASNKLTGETMMLSKRLGITAEQAGVLNTALGNIGSDSETYVSAFDKFAKQIRKNEQGLNDMGLKTRDANGNLRDSNELFTEALGKVGSYKAGLDQNIAAQTFFGKGIAEVTALQRLNNDVLEAAKKKNEELGLTITKENVEASKKYRAAMNDVRNVMVAVQKTIGDAVMPVFTELAVYFAEAGPYVVDLFKGALTGLLLVFRAVQLGVKVFVSTVSLTIDTLIDQLGNLSALLSKVFSGDFSGAADVWEQMKARSVANIRNIVQATKDAFREAQESFSQDVARVWSNGTAVGAPKSGNNRMGEKEKTGGAEESAIRQWEAELADRKLAFMEMRNAEGSFQEYSKQSEAKFWRDNLAITQTGTQDNLSVRKKIADIELSMNKERYATLLESLKAEQAAYKNNIDARIELLNSEAILVKDRYGEESKEYKAAQKAIIEARRQAAEQLKQIDQIQTQETRQALLSRVALEEQAVQLQKDLGLLTAQQALAMQRQFELDRNTISKAALIERQAIALLASDQNAVELARIHAEREALEQQHQQRMGQINGAVQKDTFAPLVNIYKAAETAIAASITGILNRTMTLKQGMAAAWKGISQSVISEISAILAKKLAAWAVDKGLALASIGTKAAVAGSGAASSVASIPFVGPVLAIAAMAAVFGAVMGMKSNVPSAAGGYDIPASVNPLTQLHEREMVLPARYADVIRQLADGSNGNSQSSSTSAMPTIELRGTHMPGGFFMAHADDIAAAVKKASRNGAFWAK